ncbi:hypothetical protein AX17_006215 [Amanita inopinata Kibby_2008]|nr:hypothetical protein AX17_006215 [Amanita inopinata Kibby_2008]
MESPQPSSPRAESNDIFSLTDQVLAEKLQFVEEIGFGNWGSVWLCRPKSPLDSSSDDDVVKGHEQKIAVKLVHRSKTATTAARVRSLWNEMKIVRMFRNDPHPAIIPFHSFIITPSYALITMTYLPTLIPVEVDESRARNWFRFLLSGVEFLHKHGVVHNDIKPANILLSEKNIPVLVDFGFAEKYDLHSSTAFHSNLSYGTPEYLSPERARGLPHDTRKSDVWSLGITFFEILVGRTPFEHSDGEQLTSKEDLERYWARTLRGKWVGTWKMTQGIEKLLRRMIAPNADLRCTATDAMADEYWHHRKITNPHRRSSSCNSSILFEKDLEKLILTPKKDQKACYTPPGLDTSAEDLTHVNDIPHQLTRSRSQPKVAVPTKIHHRKRPPMAPIVDLSPIKASPPGTPISSAAAKENANIRVLNSNQKNGRKPFGNINNRENISQPQFIKPADEEQTKRRSRVLGDLTTRHRNDENMNKGRKEREVQSKAKMSHVKERVLDWERERERLREMERLEEMEREREETEQVLKEDVHIIQDIEQGIQRRSPQDSPNVAAFSPQIASAATSALSSVASDNAPRRTSNSGLSHLKHSIKKSIDKTMQFYKSSTQGRTTPARSESFDFLDDATRGEDPSDRHSWEDEILIREADSSLPAVRHAILNERVGGDAKVDRMTIWMRNVEKVVEDARQTFALSATQPAALPPLPIAPLSRRPSGNRSNRSGRLPRKVLAASQIFTEESMRMFDQSGLTNASSADESRSNMSQILPQVDTPLRKRRATVSARSPELVETSTASHSEQPVKQNKSLASKLQLHIATLSQLEAELNKPPKPEPSPRLSQVLDRSLFIATPLSQKFSIDQNEGSTYPSMPPSMDDLTSSPLHVESYPSRKPSSQSATVLNSPDQQRLENVYDRFLMATTGVKRVGKGYQSDNAAAVSNTLNRDSTDGQPARSYRVFPTSRRHPMPPPVSSDDLNIIRPTVLVDEMGVMTCTQMGAGTPVVKDESNTTVALVRRAIKAMVPGKTASKRLSRVMA